MMAQNTGLRKKAYKRGLLAEYTCMALLMLKGYRILARRHRNSQGEIDLIAERFGTLAFIEVKARDTRETGLEAVSVQSRGRIGRAAGSYLATRTEYAGHNMRFDLMVCAPWRLPHHVQDAWRL